MRTKLSGWAMALVGILANVGMVHAQAEVPEVAGPECRNAGVTVSFAPGSSELDTNARGALAGVATWMKGDPRRTLHLQGYADPTGSPEQNLRLSDRRAESVKAYLVAQGLEATRIESAGRGEEAEHLPANGRTVTFMACEPPAAMAAANTPPPETVPSPEPLPPPEVIPPNAYPIPGLTAPEEPNPPSGSGWAIMAGGGYEAFSNSNMQTRTSGGGAWDVRLVGGLRQFAGFEAAYVGAARSFHALGAAGNSPSLVSNGLEGTLRINVPVVLADSLIEPYGFVGLGWSRYSVANYSSNSAVLSDFTSSVDTVMTVPVGGGFAYGYKALLVDVRASYVPTYYNNLLQNTNGSGALNHWGVGGQLGYAF